MLERQLDIVPLVVCRNAYEKYNSPLMSSDSPSAGDGKNGCGIWPRLAITRPRGDRGRGGSRGSLGRATPSTSSGKLLVVKGSFTKDECWNWNNYGWWNNM
ncbi:hypothetical protein C5167_003541 [Papaver somniferum]|uniref:Uncharacterized protein n=1 Tax=Papaver somniferum TaxID=3469 RepID=A0A4Y7L1B2_PAPSO|nr:hypothetical protein C5167_003541 [Papaver somniferum]